MHKVYRGNFVYYYSDTVFEMIPDEQSDIDLLRFAEFVVDVKNNKVLKCRCDLEYVFDVYMGEKYGN
jgi:hypothetical protein